MLTQGIFRKKQKVFMGALLGALLCGTVLCMTACGGTKQPDSQAGDDVTTLVLAVFEETSKLQEQVASFNERHTDYQIETALYERSEQAEEDGIARLQREIMSGRGPDIIDFGREYATSDIVGRYTENLLPYLEAAGFYSQESYFTNIWDSFTYQEGLYALPVGFTLQTFAGSREALGGLTHWNIEEMIACYQEQAEERILYPGQTKKDVFGTILTGSMEYYIDWEQGTCSFDGEEFRKVMGFAGTFPDTLEITEDYSVKQTFYEGGALLLPLRLTNIYSICRAEYIFDEEDISYIGFPVEGSSGTVINPSDTMLAISVGSGHKEAAWEFISQFLEEQYQSEMEKCFPVCRSALEKKLAENQTVEYIPDGEQGQIPIVKERVIFEGEEPVDIYCVTEAQAQKLLELIECAEISSSNDYQLYNVLLEEADSYFGGDKSLEEAAGIMQRRAELYVSERAK